MCIYIYIYYLCIYNIYVYTISVTDTHNSLDVIEQPSGHTIYFIEKPYDLIRNSNSHVASVRITEP